MSSIATFDHKNVIVIFVLGGPGAGKGTQCASLVEDFGFCHLSAGDLLRAEQHREDSEFGSLIQKCIREGSIVPMEVTIELLRGAMHNALAEHRPNWNDGHGRFLIDGFPRKMDQALKFEESVCVSSLILFFSTTEEVMLQRLLVRAQTSGREDDNIESIRKRFRTYETETMPVLAYYNSRNKVVEIDSTGTIEDVHALASLAVLDILSTKSWLGHYESGR